MQSKFIHFFLFLFFVQVHALLAKQPPSKKAILWASIEVSKLNFEQQLAQLIWTTDTTNGSAWGGIITNNSLLANKLRGTKTPYSILTIYDGVSQNTSSTLDFPSYNVRKQLSIEALQFASALYTPDFVIDIQPDKNALFYGINIEGDKLALTPHFNADSLSIALSIYHQVWWLTSNISIKENLGRGKKITKKVKKRIKNLAKSALERKYEVKENTKSKETLNDLGNYTRWAWKQYSASISLLNNPAKLPIKILDTAYFCTTTLDTDNFYAFRRHLGFYASHAFYPNALDFNTPYNLKRLASYDYLMVPATQLNEQQIKNLNTLSGKAKIILAWFSSQNPPSNLSANITQIQVPVLNGVTEALAPQLIFGALGFVSNKNKISYAPPSIGTLPLGRLQFAPPALAHVDTDILREISNVVEDGIREEAMPGSQILAAKNGIVIYYQNFGYKTYQNKDAIKDKYLYDLASLTKVMATTQAIMFLTERGLLDLDQPIAHYLSEMWGTDKEFIPVREIMAHQAGLYPYIPFWKQVLPTHDLASALSNSKSKDAFQIGQGSYIAPYLQDSLLSWSIHSKRLRTPKNEQPYGYRYSDIGFIILKTLVERIVNQPLNDFLEQNLYSPLGMNYTTYTPLCKFPSEDIVPTEGNGKFRLGELTGFVNDQNAALIGGVSGHAGLFSNALDLAKLMQMQLQLGSYGGTTYLYPETILNFTKRQYVGNRRGLGWDKPSKGPHGPTADLASQKTFGHTGFTGTAAWADPEHQLIFIFLSNRVYPNPENFKLIRLNIRTRIQSLLYQAIDYTN